MTDLATTIRDHWQRFGLVDLCIRESLNGQQAICKYRDKLTGPWGVGCDPDPAIALEKALIAGADIMSEVPQRSTYREWTPALKLPVIEDAYDDLGI